MLSLQYHWLLKQGQRADDESSAAVAGPLRALWSWKSWSARKADAAMAFLRLSSALGAEHLPLYHQQHRCAERRHDEVVSARCLGWRRLPGQVPWQG